MSLVRWTDRNMFPTINSMFDNFFADGDGCYKAVSQGTSVPAVNVVETEDNFELEVAAAGKTKEDFKVEVDNNVLCISSESEEEKETETEEKNYIRKEYSYSSFSRSFTLPDNTQEGEIKATYENGVLQISIPKNEPSTSATKSIPVG